MSTILSLPRVLPVPAWWADVGAHLGEEHRILFEDGIPQSFIGRRFRLDHEAALLSTKDGMVLRFGTSRLSDPIGIEIDTGHVIQLISARDSPRLFVNSSLSRFVETIHAVCNRFPYYDTDEDEEELRVVGDQLLDIIRRIDPPAAEPDRYWSTLVDDSRIGDLTTDAIKKVVGNLAD